MYDTFMTSTNWFLEDLNKLSDRIKSFRFMESKKNKIDGKETEQIMVLCWINERDADLFKDILHEIHLQRSGEENPIESLEKIKE